MFLSAKGPASLSGDPNIGLNRCSMRDRLPDSKACNLGSARLDERKA
jgi:hypothetical protein